VRGEGPALVETLRVRALPEGGGDDLLEFLRLYRDAAQAIVDRTWNVEGRLSIGTLHKTVLQRPRLHGLQGAPRQGDIRLR